MAIECAWAENAFVVKANLMHERVHDSGVITYSRSKKTLHNVAVYHTDDAIQGVVDCLELYPDKGAVCIAGGTYRLQLVEYKPTAPKGGGYHEADALQVFAQKLCIDEIFQTDCKATLYYADSKTRVDLPFDTQYAAYHKKLKALLAEMRAYLAQGQVPSILPKQYCGGCSFADLCMPKRKRVTPIRQQMCCILEEPL